MGSIGLINTGLPLAILAVLALVLPRLFLSRSALGQGAVLRAVLLSALVILPAGAVIYAVLLSRGGFDLAGSFTLSPMQIALLLLTRSALASIVWAPLLALSWVSLSIKVNRRHAAQQMEAGHG